MLFAAATRFPQSLVCTLIWLTQQHIVILHPYHQVLQQSMMQSVMQSVIQSVSCATCAQITSPGKQSDKVHAVQAVQNMRMGTGPQGQDCAGDAGHTAQG